jgi:hypothetical protein
VAVGVDIGVNRGPDQSEEMKNSQEERGNGAHRRSPNFS